MENKRYGMVWIRDWVNGIVFPEYLKTVVLSNQSKQVFERVVPDYGNTIYPVPYLAIFQENSAPPKWPFKATIVSLSLLILFCIRPLCSLQGMGIMQIGIGILRHCFDTHTVEGRPLNNHMSSSQLRQLTLAQFCDPVGLSYTPSQTPPNYLLLINHTHTLYHACSLSPTGQPLKQEVRRSDERSCLSLLPTVLTNMY